MVSKSTRNKEHRHTHTTRHSQSVIEGQYIQHKQSALWEKIPSKFFIILCGFQLKWVELTKDDAVIKQPGGQQQPALNQLNKHKGKLGGCSDD